MQNKKDDSPFEMVLAVLGIGVILLGVVFGGLVYFMSSPETPGDPPRQTTVQSPTRQNGTDGKADSVVRSHKAAPSAGDKEPHRKNARSSGGGNSSSGSSGGQSSGEAAPSFHGSNSSGNSGPKLIKKFRGEGHESLPAFSVAGPWKLKWKSAGLFFAGYLYNDKTDKLVKTIKSRSTSEEGELMEEGRYYLKVNASNEWKVLVIQP